MSRGGLMRIWQLGLGGGLCLVAWFLTLGLFTIGPWDLPASMDISDGLDALVIGMVVGIVLAIALGIGGVLLVWKGARKF